MIDYSKVDNVVVENIDMSDYPDFSDAHIVSADYDGKPMSEVQIELLNEDSDFVYWCVQERLY